ncbi:hypothetical protein HDV01_007833 [Terramyces sp. JEL0728]|nr:hypothetical protein HDV01_007833 [Terramyces sp. JEL0728]
MADRLASSYIVPQLIILGAALQKNFQTFHIACQNYGKKSRYFYAAVATGLLNMVSLLFYIAMTDYTVSPYNWKNYNLVALLAVITIGISNSILYLVILQRLPVVQSVTVLFVALNAFLQAVNFVAASVMFIFNIASKLGVSNRELASQLIMKYALLDYVILAGYKIYTCVALIILLKNNRVSTNITLVGVNGLNCLRQRMNLLKVGMLFKQRESLKKAITECIVVFGNESL